MASKQRILIVDDDENIAELISLYLTKECYEDVYKRQGICFLLEFLLVSYIKQNLFSFIILVVNYCFHH